MVIKEFLRDMDGDITLFIEAPNDELLLRRRPVGVESVESMDILWGNATGSWQARSTEGYQIHKVLG